MSKSLTFTDKELIEKIETFQKDKGLASFVEAVRVLCTDALNIKKAVK